MESARRLARQVRPRRVAHALFARHARTDHRRAATWFAQSGHAGSFERYVVRLYLVAWVTALVAGAVAAATRTTPLRAVVAGGAAVGIVRLLAVQAGIARLRVACWRRRHALDRATPHAVVTLRRCVAGTTDRRRRGSRSSSSRRRSPPRRAVASFGESLPRSPATARRRLRSRDRGAGLTTGGETRRERPPRRRLPENGNVHNGLTD